MKQSQRHSLLLEILLVVAVITLTGALGFHYFEKDIPRDDRGTLITFADSFWWSLVTMTTIGYGDIYPKSLGGRIVALFLMFGGIGTIGVSTAAIAAYFIKSDQLQSWRLRRLHGHVVICGLGDKGMLLTKAFREQGQPVVVIEQDDD